jgi:hypothetical protein
VVQARNINVVTEPITKLPKVVCSANVNLGVKYEKTVEAILGRWTDIATIHRIPERPELFSESWLRAESIRELGDQEIIRIFDSISRIVRNEVPKPLKYKRFLRRVG